MGRVARLLSRFGVLPYVLLGLALVGTGATVLAVRTSDADGPPPPATLSPADAPALAAAPGLAPTCAAAVDDGDGARGVGAAVAATLGDDRTEPVGPAAARALVEAACELARPGASVGEAMASLARGIGVGGPAVLVCDATLRDDRRLARIVAPAATADRRLARLFDRRPRPGIERLHAELRRSAQASGAAARALRGPAGFETATARARASELARLLADWNRAARRATGGTASADAWVARFGARGALRRVEDWFDELSGLRRRARTLAAETRGAPPSAGPGCAPSGIPNLV